MNQIVQKNFLNPLLNSTQQNLSATSFAFDLARSAGLTFKTNGNFESSTQLTGTNQDDTVTIGGNLIGGKNEATSIDLLDGNDTIMVGGDLIAYDQQSISLTSNTGSKTIHINGGIEADNATVNVRIENKDTLANINTITVNRAIKSSNQADIDIYLDGKENIINFNEDISAINSSSLDFFSMSEHTFININGSLYSNSSYITIDSEFFDDTDKSTNANINIDGSILASNNSTIDISLSSNNTYITCKDIIAKESSSINLTTTHSYALLNDFLIHGNIIITDDSSFNLHTNSKADFVVSGSLIVQNSYLDMDVHGGNITILGGISNTDGYLEIYSGPRGGTDIYNLYIEGDVIANNAVISESNVSQNTFILDGGDVTFTLIGNLIANNDSTNEILTSEGSDTITIIGDVSVSNGGVNSIGTGYGDDIINLNGHITVGALEINMSEGNDTLVLTANTQKLFDENYKEWLTDLSTSGSLAESGIETIRLDVNYIQQSKLGWLTDIINKANADGAHIAVEDKAGHQLVSPSAYLAQNNDTHNPINDVLDHYAPAAAAAQPKAFAENAAAPSAEAFAAPHFDNNSFLHEMEQQAQAHAVAS